MQLALAVKRQQQHEQRKAPALEATAKIDARIRRLFPFELTAGPAAGDRRDCRRHGRPAADEPALAGGRGQRQDGGGGVRHAAGGRPRLPGGADGPHGSPRPATRPDARPDAGRQPGPPGAADRRADGRAAVRPAATDRRRRGRPRGRHAGDHPGGRFLRQARAGGDRRAAQVRRASAGEAQSRRQNGDARPALPGDDRHAHPAHRSP